MVFLFMALTFVNWEFVLFNGLKDLHRLVLILRQLGGLIGCTTHTARLCDIIRPMKIKKLKDASDH